MVYVAFPLCPYINSMRGRRGMNPQGGYNCGQFLVKQPALDDINPNFLDGMKGKLPSSSQMIKTRHCLQSY